MDLVAEHHRAMLGGEVGKGFEVGSGVDETDGVVRMAQQNRTRPGSECRGDAVEVEAPHVGGAGPPATKRLVVEHA